MLLFTEKINGNLSQLRWSPRRFICVAAGVFRSVRYQDHRKPCYPDYRHARGLAAMCLPIQAFHLQPSLDMALPAVVPRLLYGAKRAGHPLFFKPAIPFVHQPHFADSDNPDYRLHDL